MEIAQFYITVKASFRPAYQDELEELEADLKLMYDDYVVKFRNSMYLENLLEEYRKAEFLKSPIIPVHTFSSIYLGNLFLTVTLKHVWSTYCQTDFKLIIGFIFLDSHKNFPLGF